MKNVHELEATLKGKEWKEAIDKAFLSEQKNAKVDGFRKGKVPRAVYEKKYGKMSLYYAAINNEIGNMYTKLL